MRFVAAGDLAVSVEWAEEILELGEPGAEVYGVAASFASQGGRDRSYGDGEASAAAMKATDGTYSF